jgi:glycosyltransferase involved in cell wall biosynthesis
MAAALGVHRLLGTWRSQVDAFLLLSEHARAVFVRAGLPPAALIVKPNFVDPDPGMGSHDGTSAVFAGRLSSEKGVTFLLELWQSMGHDIPLRIYGDGPLRGAVEAAAARNGTVTYGGVVSQEDLRRALGSARVLLVPSVADGDVPTVMLQALAVGLPVVAGRTGALREAVRDGVFGMTVPVGDIDAWRGAIMQVLSSAAWRNLSRGAREEYMSRYSGEVAYPGLMTAYESVLGNTRRRRA